FTAGEAGTKARSGPREAGGGPQPVAGRPGRRAPPGPPPPRAGAPVDQPGARGGFGPEARGSGRAVS
ncbi:hypothetical protein ACFWIJ_46480, partial [Streptomyces sp. NPDC127079]